MSFDGWCCMRASSVSKIRLSSSRPSDNRVSQAVTKSSGGGAVYRPPASPTSMRAQCNIWRSTSSSASSAGNHPDSTNRTYLSFNPQGKMSGTTADSLCWRATCRRRITHEIPRSRPYILSPRIGAPSHSACARIWCFRPVIGVTATRV